MKYRDYNFLGMTQSLCPECLELVQAKIVSRDERVYFQKHCSTHGFREDFVCSDVNWFDRTDFSLPGKIPTSFGTERQRGCPYDCGLCEEHEQHTCIGLLEITSHCNLECPICFAGSGPGGNHLSVTQCKAAIDRLVEVETQPEVLQLSGGEPTIHPDFETILQYACEQPIDIVMINTNGVRIARDPAFVEMLASLNHRCEVYFQFDSFEEIETEAIRGQSLVQTKLKAIETLGAHGIRTTLVCTLQAGINEDQIGPIAKFAMERPWITGVSFQPTTYAGRFFLPEDLEDRITFPDVIKKLQTQTDGDWLTTDFSPLPCAHPNGHSLAYAFRAFDKSAVKFLPLARFIDMEKHLDLLSGRITFDRERAKTLIQTVLDGMGCGSGFAGELAGCRPDALASLANHIERPTSPFQWKPESLSDKPNQFDDKGDKAKSLLAQGGLVTDFLQRGLSKSLAPEDMLRITTTSFMDAYNFDVRQLMKSCVHHILPTGHLIPFSAYNVLYRDGKVLLPSLNLKVLQ